MDLEGCNCSDLGMTPDIVPIRTVFLHVTRACNLHCAYCYVSAGGPLPFPDEMRTEEFTRLWPQMVALRPEKVVFTGGEPLLRPDILDLLNGLRDADPEHRTLRCLNTNGYPVTEDLAVALVGLADEVRVSVDALRERNDVLRGPGHFEAALRAIEIYHAVGFEPKVLVTVTSLGLADLEELLCLLMERKVSRINLNRFHTVGRGEGHPELLPDTSEIQAIVRRARARCRPAESPPPESPELEGQSHCGAGQFLNILPNGDVFPCHALTGAVFRCGNVREQPLAEICHRHGLLGALASLNFRELARHDGRVIGLTQPDACMGEVYAKTRSLPVWSRSLPLGQ